jgi:hypothetical protein
MEANDNTNNDNKSSQNCQNKRMKRDWNFGSVGSTVYYDWQQGQFNPLNYTINRNQPNQCITVTDNVVNDNTAAPFSSSPAIVNLWKEVQGNKSNNPTAATILSTNDISHSSSNLFARVNNSLRISQLESDYCLLKNELDQLKIRHDQVETILLMSLQENKQMQQKLQHLFNKLNADALLEKE